MLHIFLQSQSNPLGPLTSLLGFAIAMIWLFTRKGRKEQKENREAEDNSNKMQ